MKMFRFVCDVRRSLLPTILTLLLLLVGPCLCEGASVTAWGNNTYNQTNVPPDLTNVAALAAGNSQSLALCQDGTVATWGGNLDALTNAPSGLSNVVQIAGGGTHSLALRADGTVVGWGANYYPDTNTVTGQATPPSDLANATAIAAGWAHSVALRYDRTVIAWGYNGSGQTNIPVNMGPAIAVAAGDWFSAALREDGTVKVWGSNSAGQTNVPASLSNVVAIAAGGSTMLALKRDGRVVAWGSGSLGQTNVPADLTNAVAISAGSAFALALREDGSIAAWGDNSAGQITAAAGLARVTGIAAGGSHAIAMLGDGSPQLVLQPRNQSAFSSSNVTFVAKAVGDPPLGYQWFREGISITNGGNLSGATSASLTLTNISTTNAGGYSLVITNASGSVTSLVATLTMLTPVAPDSFNPAASNPGGNSTVYALAVQPDGKVLVGGAFTTLAGQTRSRIARLNADGSLDGNFNPGALATSPYVYSLAVQPNGQVFVGGVFTSLGGLACTNLGRLNPDGSLDATFATGANAATYALAFQTDGKILVGGTFTKLGSQTCPYLGRLNPDGSLDTSFNPGSGSSVYALALQSDGKILVGGSFTSLGGQTCNRIGRLNADGSLDSSFNPGASGGSVYSLAVQADGKILVGGTFSTLGGQIRMCIARLNPDGSLDTGFNPGSVTSVYSLAVQADGKILLGGGFTHLAGQARSYLGRLNSDGSLDSTFNLGANSSVYALALQSGGRILAGGDFSALGGQTRLRIGRVNNTAQPIENLGFDGSTITWSRGGTGPEAWRTTFDVSTNGSTWASFANGTRMIGGWQAQGVSLPTNATLRARGFFTGGQYNGSSWFAEASSGPAAISSQPTDVEDFAGTNISFSVVVAGTSPFSFQWLKNGLPIADATNLAFNLPAATAGDAGSYQVVVSNLSGTVTSAVARLKILNPPVPDAFNPTFGGVSTPAVYALALQRDGKVLVGGYFSKLGGQNCSYMGRLNADGTVDTGFTAGVDASYLASSVNSLVVAPDGKILVGGNFSTALPSAYDYMRRLDPDGRLDLGFRLNLNGTIYSLALQPDGKVLVSGSFSTICGQSRSYLARINADGTLDNGFNPQPNSSIYALALQPDGKILLGGVFTGLGGQTRSRIGRVNADGTLDTSFDSTASDSVHAFAVQPDGRILVGGKFATLGGQARNCIGRLNSGGSLDTTFNPGAGANNPVYTLAVQADGRIMAGGTFTAVGGQTRNYLARLNSDGSLDTKFNPGANGYVYALALQADGKLLSGGTFTTLGTQARTYAGRLITTEAPTETLTFDGQTVTWLRAGTAPEIWRAAFQFSTNGADWFGIPGTRIAGGWQQTGLSLPTHATVRAQGFCASGQYSASAGVMEASIGAPALVSQLQNIGSFTNTATGFTPGIVGSPPLAYQWFKNGIPIANATGSALTIPSSAYSDAGDYQVVATNAFGAVTSQVATLTIWYSPAPDALNPAANGAVFAFAPQPDGRVVLGGTFTSLGGTSRRRLGRLDAQGGLDAAFDPAASSTINAVGIQTDGKVVVGGAFTNLAQKAITGLGRLNPDGSLDETFNPRANGTVYALRLQADNTLLVGGGFTSLCGSECRHLGRLNADGSLDQGFHPEVGGPVGALALQADGKIVVGGSFTNLGGLYRNNLGRLNADGTVDSSFDTQPDAFVYSLAVQADDKILVGGSFTTLGGQPRSALARLNPDGSLDTAFVAGAAKVYSLAIQTDGRILAGGEFINLAGYRREFIGRLNADGTIDTSFNSGADAVVYSLALQADGRILVGGGFTKIAGQGRGRGARLNNTGPATESLGFDGSTVTWQRGGTGPEVWRTTFDGCTNGIEWIQLGTGSRIPGGWQLSGVTFTAAGTIRARGFCTGAQYGSSSWFVESGLGPAAISLQPTSRTNNAGTVAQFVTVGAGTAPFGYQWRKGGVPVSDGGTVSGTQTSTLTLTNVLGADAGEYSVIITNSSGSVTSQVAVLTVIDPCLLTQPVSVTTNAGATVLFSATALGTDTLSYQWRRNGLALAGATASSLALTNVQWADAGSFSLVVSNAIGALTSSVATLSVNGPVILAGEGNLQMGTNGFGFKIGCDPGKTVVVQAATNLANWAPVQTNVISSEGVWSFVDPATDGFPQRFYRAVLAP